MRKLLFTLLIGLSATFSVFGQDEPSADWTKGADLNSTFFQSSFVNWTDGGENTVTVGLLGNAFAKYKKDKIAWDNNLIFQYSIQRVGSNDNPFAKNIDKLELLSIAGYQMSDRLYASMLGSIKTQLTASEADGIVVSRFFAPGEILLGPGVKYGYGDKKTKDNLAINFSPATAKFLIVRDQAIADAGIHTGVPATYDTSGVKLTDGETMRFEFGASLIGFYRINLSDNVTYSTNLELFSNYLESPLSVDVKWFNMLSMQVWKVFSVTLSTDVRWDRDVLVPIDTNNDGVNDDTDARVRFAQTFGIGLGYKFGAK